MSTRRRKADGPAVRTERLVRNFGDNVTVEGVELKVPPGEIYGFVGPNGAGKTTTVRMLVTLLAPSAGRAWVAGRDVVSDPSGVRLRIGVAPRCPNARLLLRMQGRASNSLWGLARSASRVSGGDGSAP